MKQYRITSAFMLSDAGILFSAIFPGVTPGYAEYSDHYILVTVPDSAPAPADLGPLVKVELVTATSN